MLGIVPSLFAQSTSGTLSGTVKDSSGAFVPNATVHIENPVSGYSQSVTTDGAGRYSFLNIPFDPYRVIASSTALQGK